MDWNVAQYTRYTDERSRPFADLVAVVGAEAPREVVDLGCGDGRLLAGLASRWPQARLMGLDSSAEMVAAAPAPTATFAVQQADLASFVPGSQTDVVISNAALQWVDEHRTLLRAWADAVQPGAWLAWQVPGNFTAPSHELMRQLAESPRWHDRLHGVLRPADTTDSAQQYATLLLERGWDVQAWETTYLHLLQGEDAVLEWVRGTGLRPALAALSAQEAHEFESEYSTLLDEAYPPTPQGTWFPFRRVFCVGHKR